MIDTHAHLDACEDPPDVLVSRAREVGVDRILTVATTVDAAAMALELAVVSTDAGGMGEVLTDGVDAVVLPVGDPGSLVSAIERLAEQPALAAELGAAVRRTVHGGYTLERQRRQWGDLYEQLLTTSPERSR